MGNTVRNAYFIKRSVGNTHLEMESRGFRDFAMQRFGYFNET